MLDASYFIGGGLTVEDRRAHEEELVRGYHDELLAHGVAGLLLGARAGRSTAASASTGSLMTVAASMVVVADRARRRHVHGLARAQRPAGARPRRARRCCPSRAPGDRRALRPEPRGRGPPRARPRGRCGTRAGTSTPSATTADARRLRAHSAACPTRTSALYTACICGPGRPTVMLVDADAPLPAADDDSQAIDVDGLRAEQHCEEPLRALPRHARAARRRRTPTQSAPLRGEAGEPVEVALDLIWETDGMPYAWRPVDPLRDPVPGHAAR